MPEFVCLRILAASPGRSNADLARETHVSAQAMNQLLRRLEAMGAVARPASAPPTGRALPAELTDEGRTLHERAERAVRIADQRVLDKLLPTEQRHLKKTLLRKAALHDPAVQQFPPTACR